MDEKRAFFDIWLGVVKLFFCEKFKVQWNITAQKVVDQIHSLPSHWLQGHSCANFTQEIHFQPLREHDMSIPDQVINTREVASFSS